LLPLAILNQVPAGVVLLDGLHATLDRIVQRLKPEVEPGKIRRLWTAVCVSSGLRVTPREARKLVEGVTGVRDATTCRAIRDEGAFAAAQKLSLLQGIQRFGKPTEATRAQIMSVEDLE
jgi:hypothetical protein